ncbi:MAG: transglutaminase family protein, partial [Pseudomonadales bacterium]|nr:transglutaminase family protein [Pseudomonadales bacterium]
MAIQVAIHHETRYHFDRLVQVMPHLVRLRPAPHCRTPISAYSLLVEPKDHFINWQQDPFSNHLARLVFPEKTKELIIRVELLADMTVINPFDFFLEESAEFFPFQYDPQLARDLAPYLEIKDDSPELRAWVKAADASKQALVNFLVNENARTQHVVNYVIRMEPGVQTPAETLQSQYGSCRDSAWLMVQTLRHLGLAARFASGYLVQLATDIKAIDGPSGPEEDFTDLHAWVEVFVPGAGWIGLDPTSGLFASEGHIPLACTPDPVSAAPITGSTEVCQVSFEHLNKVTRFHEDPRVSKPYTPLQWQQIDKLGQHIDQDLDKQDVRLTMGGEPTFVSSEDMEGAEWNTAALGEDKRRLAGELLHRLKTHFGSDGLLHHGQGKWYPGEPLPRWALGLFWRTDRKPLWHEPALLANDRLPGKSTTAQAEALIRQIADRLELDQSFIVTAYENKSHYENLAAELPENLSVTDNAIKDPLERERLKKVFAQGLDKAIGFVLPLGWEEQGSEPGWRSSRWSFREEVMHLLPGDSAMGYRLPLDSLPWE